MRPDIFNMAAARASAAGALIAADSKRLHPMRQIRFDFLGIRQDSSPVPLASIRARVVLRQAADCAYDLGTHVSDGDGQIFLPAPPPDGSGRREQIDIHVEQTPFSGSCIGKIEDEKVWCPLPGVLMVEALPVIRVHMTQLSHA